MNNNECLRGFGKLKVNDTRHPLWGHTFNPYDKNRPSHYLDKSLFDSFCKSFPHDATLAIDAMFIGLIDAPDVIPMGSTECIRTCGGFEREEYRNERRGCTDWKASAVASNEVAEMIKQILSDLDD